MATDSASGTRSPQSPTVKMARNSLSQPQHRRPDWAKTEASYKANIKVTNRHYGPATDHGLDNFSYDPAHLAQFYIPEHLIEVMPDELRKAARKWMYAGAALETAFDRIEKLQQNPLERVERADPDYGSASRRSSVPDTNGTGLETPATSAKGSVIIAPIASRDPKVTVVNPYSGMPSSMFGMESPPFTPVETRGPGTPSNSFTTGTVPDLHRLNAQLYPLSSSQQLQQQQQPHQHQQDTLLTPTSSTASSLSAHDPCTTSLSSIAAEVKATRALAYENYAKTWNAELYDLRYTSCTRFAGVDRRVRKLLVELEGQENSLPADLKAAVGSFRRLFARTRDMVGEFQARVKELRLLELP